MAIVGSTVLCNLKSFSASRDEMQHADRVRNALEEAKGNTTNGQGVLALFYPSTTSPIEISSSSSSSSSDDWDVKGSNSDGEGSDSDNDNDDNNVDDADADEPETLTEQNGRPIFY